MKLHFQKQIVRVPLVTHMFAKNRAYCKMGARRPSEGVTPRVFLGQLGTYGLAGPEKDYSSLISSMRLQWL